MSTTARRCAACGAPLPEVEPGTSHITCGFCGVVNDIAATGSVTVHVDAAGAAAGAARLTRTVARLIVLGLVLAVAGTAAGLYVAFRTVQRTTTPSSGPARPPDPRPRVVAPSDLNTMPDTGWHTLDVAAPPSGWPAFDPVADLAWAQDIGRAWHADAVLTRVDVKRLTPDGTLNLQDGVEDQAGYRFVSPAQTEEWSRRAARGDVNPTVGYELMLIVERQRVRAIVSFGRPYTRELPPPAVDTMRLGPLLAAASGQPRFRSAAFYDGYLIHNRREGWVWYLQARGQLEPSPRVRAADGAVYPYRGQAQKSRRAQ